MSIRYREDRNCWIVDTVWPDGLRTKTRMPDETTARRINKKIEVATVDEERIWKKLRTELRLEGGILQGLSEFADFYYESYVLSHNRSAKSKKSRLGILKAHFSSLPIDSLTPQHIDKFISARRKNVSNGTINRDLTVLSHMYEWAIRRGYLDLNPLARVERLEEVEWVGERPDESMIDSIFVVLHQTTVPVFTFLRETGCRRGEAITLRWPQVDYARAQVVFHSNTKNGRSRQVPLTELALWSLAVMPKRGETVFYNPDTMKKWTGDGIDYRWEKARESVKSGLRVHDLRHAYGIRLAEQGCAMHFISEVMGHHSVDFTRKYYAKFSPESASKAVLRVLEGRKAAQA
jgi:integrase